MADDAIALNVVEDAANLFGGVLLMIEERNELRDRAFKVNIVLPEGIVRVDEKRLGCQLAGGKTHAVLCYCAANFWAAV